MEEASNKASMESARGQVRGQVERNETRKSVQEDLSTASMAGCPVAETLGARIDRVLAETSATREKLGAEMMNIRYLRDSLPHGVLGVSTETLKELLFSRRL